MVRTTIERHIKMLLYLWLSAIVCYPLSMDRKRFEWDENKNRQNQEKHGIAFETAQYAFADQQLPLLSRA